MKSTISKQQWLDWIEEQQKSGLSVAAFCRDNMINADKFYYHRGQLNKPSPPDGSVFVRAQRTDPQLTINKSDLTLTIGRSRLQVPGNVSPQWLAALMTSLA